MICACRNQSQHSYVIQKLFLLLYMMFQKDVQKTGGWVMMSKTIKIGYVSMGLEVIHKCSGDSRIRTDNKIDVCWRHLWGKLGV